MTKKDLEFVSFYKRIEKKKWIWILTIAFMANVIGFFIEILFGTIMKDSIELTTTLSVLKRFFHSAPISLLIAFLLYDVQRKKYKNY